MTVSAPIHHTDIENADGKTAVDLARQWGYSDIVKFIDNYRGTDHLWLVFRNHEGNLLIDQHDGDNNVNSETLSNSSDDIMVGDVATINNYKILAMYCYSTYQWSPEA